MSNIARVAGQAANTTVKPLNVEDVFSTYVSYAGSGTLTVDQGIDLSGEGGMWWGRIRNISGAFDGRLEIHDTERGAGNYVRSNDTGGQVTGSYNFLSTFTSTGYTGWNGVSGYDVASWTFRKAPKFFDVVTYTGDGNSTQTISHDLGTTVGAIFVKRTDATDNWAVYHREMDATSPSSYYMRLDEGVARINTTSRFGGVEPTSTEFTVGSNAAVNASGGTYVAYLFAHNDGDGGFGPTGDQDIIKCGSYTEPASGSLSIDLGFEPQFILTKSSSYVGQWNLLDTMRGITDNQFTRIEVEGTSAEQTFSSGYVYPLPTGFNAPSGFYNSGVEVIYIAIRRGPMAVPTDATDVFAIDDAQATSGSGPAFITNFVTDMLLEKQPSTSGSWPIGARLQGNKYLVTNATSVETTGSSITWDYMNGTSEPFNVSPAYQAWMWKRAPNYFDVVAYTGNSTAGNTISHNLGVAPEMMWVKRRDTSAADWAVYHSALGNTKQLVLNSTVAEGTVAYWNNTTPTETNFTLGAAARVNNSGSKFIAYLFASLDGVSKVGSFTHSGGNTNVDCGFSSGARFVLIKKSSDTSGWFLWDSERGIVAGNDPYLLLNSTAAEFSVDTIDPYSSGFTITDVQGSGTYIFYAIA